MDGLSLDCDPFFGATTTGKQTFGYDATARAYACNNIEILNTLAKPPPPPPPPPPTSQRRRRPRRLVRATYYGRADARGPARLGLFSSFLHFPPLPSPPPVDDDDHHQQQQQPPFGRRGSRGSRPAPRNADDGADKDNVEIERLDIRRRRAPRRQRHRQGRGGFTKSTGSAAKTARRLGGAKEGIRIVDCLSVCVDEMKRGFFVPTVMESAVAAGTGPTFHFAEVLERAVHRFRHAIRWLWIANCDDDDGDDDDSEIDDLEDQVPRPRRQSAAGWSSERIRSESCRRGACNTWMGRSQAKPPAAAPTTSSR
ncbi:hypothetical protein DFJ73DRAFT_761385 [Zopfochytrium polystomum]|nr:hypothetical protein DFJ73DRAFT_761385 [Zopfochytrium polystomum]